MIISERKIAAARLDRDPENIKTIVGLGPDRLCRGKYWKYFPNIVAAIVQSSPPAAWYEFGRRKQLWILMASKSQTLAKNSYFESFPKSISLEFITWFLKTNETPLTLAACLRDLLHDPNIDRVKLAKKILSGYGEKIRKVMIGLIFQPDHELTRKPIYPFELLDYAIDDVTAAVIMMKIYIVATAPIHYTIAYIILQKYPRAVTHLNLSSINLTKTDNLFIERVIDTLSMGELKRLMYRCVETNDHNLGIEFFLQGLVEISNSPAEIREIYKYPGKIKSLIDYLELLLKRYHQGLEWYVSVRANKRRYYWRYRRASLRYASIMHIVSDRKLWLKTVILTDQLIIACLLIMGKVSAYYKKICSEGRS